MTFVLIDNSLGQGDCCRLFEDPGAIVEARTAKEVGPALNRLEEAIDQGYHAAGFFSYELGYLLEPHLAPLLPRKRELPLIWFGLFRAGTDLSADAAGTWLRAKAGGSHRTSRLTPMLSEAQYLERFALVREMIAAGDIYQMNLTFKSRFQLTGSALSLYLDLRARQQVAYGALIRADDFHVLSSSPELFIRRRGSKIETRPMKGTGPRGPNAKADMAARRALAADAKQRAENLMIVDLMRNDLGRIAKIGSLEVSDLFAVETYPTLHQMTTTVRATLRQRLPMRELLTALFPPGSVTGAPKIRAMELIAAIEDCPRGVYTGAIGMIAPGGDWLFNVAIRTAVVFRGGCGEIGLGSGVVADSDGKAEYAECLLKSKFFTDMQTKSAARPRPEAEPQAEAQPQFQLIETILYDGARDFFLLERHLARLARSARIFGFGFDEGAARDKLSKQVSGRRQERARLRLLLGRDGDMSVVATEQPPEQPGAVMRFALSPTRLDPDNQFLFHKTTRRQLYDREFSRFEKELGADEVIYLNKHGQLTEGSRTNIFVERDGKLLTPAVGCGLLPGTLREELIASGRAVEAVLTLDDLAGADAVYLGNSVRGLRRAVPLPHQT